MGGLHTHQAADDFCQHALLLTATGNSGDYRGKFCANCTTELKCWCCIPVTRVLPVPATGNACVLQSPLFLVLYCRLLGLEVQAIDVPSFHVLVFHHTTDLLLPFSSGVHRTLSCCVRLQLQLSEAVLFSAFSCVHHCSGVSI